jgi:hypothetical protein
MTHYIQVERTNPELLAAMPEAGTFTAFHRSPKGTNFMERGDDRDRLVTKVAYLSTKHGYAWDDVLDTTKEV